MIISLIFAMDANRVIGNGNELPWYLPSDLKRFKELTTGHPVIMGRKTFESILARINGPLPNRTNVVITRDVHAWAHRQGTYPDTFHNCLFVSSLPDAIRVMEPAPEVFIIGGAEIYAEALPLADKMYFTQVGGKFEGDVKFPRFNPHQWKIVHDELVRTDNHPYAFSILARTTRMKSLAASLSNDAKLVNPTFARSGGYDGTIADIIKAGVCPFCPETFLWHPWPILHRSGNWFITRSGWPYANADYHFIILGDRHIATDIEMTVGDNASVQRLVRWAVEQFGHKGWGRIDRSGETSHTGATVQHLHFHLIQPKIGEDGKALTVFFPIG